jgi:zinc protease
MHHRASSPSSVNTIHSLPGPDDIVRVDLGNGIVILARSNFNSPSVVIQGYLSAGALSDPQDKLGLAYFSALGLMRGSATRSFQQIYDILESAGASLGFSGGTHTTTFGGKALAEDLDLLLTMASEAMRQPVYPPEQIERLRAQLLTGLAIRAQDTAEMASLAFDRVIYTGHPYQNPEDGFPETISAIQTSDLHAFHQNFYGPRGMVIAVVGGVEPGKAVDAAAKAVGDWQNLQQAATPSLPGLSKLAETRRVKVNIEGKAQSDVVLGVAGPARREPNFMAASLGNNILGQFGMMGRLGESVREQAGLAYYIASSLSGGIGPGPWDISAGVDPENVEQTIELILEELHHFYQEPVTPEELADSQANYIGRLPLSLESNTGVASALLTLERFNLGLDYYGRYPDMVRSVTPEQVLEAARQYLDPERLGIAVAGP